MENSVIATTTSSTQSNSQHWCHACQNHVNVSRFLLPSGDRYCDDCGSTFLEEVVNHVAHPRTFEPDQPRSSNVNSSNSGNRAEQIPSAASTQTEQVSSENRAMLSSSSLNSYLANSITSIIQQVVNVVQNNPRLNLSPRNPVSVYVHNSPSGNFDWTSELNGGSYEQLLHQILMNSGLRGNPPAAKSVVETLKRNKKIIDSQVDALNEEQRDCAVCKDSFAVGAEVLELDCGHNFCVGCILPWLKMHNTCPVCRKELPTDDADYESMKKARNSR